MHTAWLKSTLHACQHKLEVCAELLFKAALLRICRNVTHVEGGVLLRAVGLPGKSLFVMLKHPSQVLVMHCVDCAAHGVNAVPQQTYLQDWQALDEGQVRDNLLSSMDQGSLWRRPQTPLPICIELGQAEMNDRCVQ